MSWSILREGGVPPSTLAVEVEVLEQLPSARRPRRLQVDVRYAQLLAGLPPQPETRKLRCPAEVIQPSAVMALRTAVRRHAHLHICRV